jgi:hypothetical protein
MPSIDLTDEQRLLIAQTVDEVRVQRATRVIAGGHGSLQRGDASCPAPAEFREAHQYLESWEPVVRAVSNNEKPPPTPPPPVTQLGPFNTGSIVFDGGVPVGGFSSLTLRSDGSYTFSGHFHVSGAPSYNVQQAWAIADGDGHVYTFKKNGHVAGTFEPGSRDFDWNDSGTNPALAAGFASLANRYRWQWNASANWDVAALVDSVIAAVKAAGFVVNVITAIV